MKSRKWTMQIILLALALLMLSVAFFAFKPAYAQEAYVWTDKQHYTYDETVTIFGSGFLADANVTITITAPNSSVATIYAWTDEFGGFEAYYTLDGMTGTYTITATDGTNTATTTFYEPGIAINTFKDADCTVGETVFYQGDTVYANATGLDKNKYYKIQWYYDAVLKRESSETTGVTSLTDSYTLAANAEIGIWYAKILEWDARHSEWDVKDAATFYVWHQIAPTADSWVESHKPNDNHGSENTLHVKVEVDKDGKVTNVRRTYLKFDLSGLPSGAIIDSAILHLYRTEDSDIPSAYTTTDAWTETGITWNNQPGPGTFICDGALESGNWFKWNLTSYVASEFAGDKIVSVVLKFKVESGSDQHMDFTSSEGTWNQRPWLEISYHMPPPTATITFSQVGVDTDFSDVVLTVDGTNYNVTQLPISFNWTLGSDHTFAYHSPLTVDTGKQYVWTRTEGLSTAQSGTITVPSGGGSVTAYYKTQYYLTVTSDHGVPSGAGWYDANATAYARLDTGNITIDGTRYLFVQWSSDASGTNYAQSDPITMDGPKFAVALWKTQYYLTVVSPYGATGGEGWYDKYTYAQATVTPLIVPGATGVQYVFTGWSGNASGTTSPSDPIYMDGPKTAIANWKTQYYLTVKTIPSGITISGEGWYNSSLSVQLTAPTVSGYTFNYWDVDGTQLNGNPITVVMNASHTATAHYSVVPAMATVTFGVIGVDSDFTGVVLTVDGVNYNVSDLPKSFKWTVGSVHTFEYHSPLLVGMNKRYVWASTAGLSTLQSGTITVSSDGGTVTGYYNTQYSVIVGQSGVGGDFAGTVVIVDGVSLKVADLPKSYWWDSGSSHSFAFQSPLTVDAAKQYVWISTSGLSAARSGSLVITGSGNIIGNYEVYVPPAQVDLTCQCYVTDGGFRKIGSFTTVFTRVNYATYRLSYTKPNAFYYCIQITNPGATGVSGVVLSFKLDPEFVIVGSDPVQVHTGYGRTGSHVSATVSYNLNSGTVNISSIGAGQTLYVTISMDYKFKGQTFTRSQALNWVVNHPSNKFSCTLQNPVTHQCSATIKDPAEIEPQWTGYMQAATLVGLTLTGFGLAFKLSARRGHGKGKFQKFCIE